MDRRQLLAVLPFCGVAHAQNLEQPRPSPVDAVVAYIVPTDDVAEAPVGELARTLTKETGHWIKATLWAPSDVSEPMPGTNQYPAEDYLPIGPRVARTLSDASPRTYFIVLTNRDINSKSRNLRFQFSMHSPMANTSVLSIARLLFNSDGSSAQPAVVGTRVVKMVMRVVGEMRLGWTRASDPTDLMYAPIMSVDDIDRLGLTHAVQPRKAQ